MPFVVDVCVVFRAQQGLPWTDRFPFRPTFELVARHLYGELAPEVPGLAFVELEDRTYGSRTRYLPSPSLPDQP